ncbi:RNA polymerase sigma factor [Shewanella corallii]|uniref:RNA polymerase sigma factor n=1 Tax=Shewanella corallii TaxID=560080 RepID=UPI003204EE16
MALKSIPETDQHQAFWIEQARAGDQQAFHQLYLKYRNRVYTLALRLAADIPLAEELTQDCFVHLWQQLHQFDGHSEFATWMHRVCVNQCLYSLRRHQRFWHRFLPGETDIEVHGHQYQGLDKMLLKLPQRARQVFVLHALEGYRHEEIAELMQIASGTSKAQYHRARQLLKEMLV